MYIISIIHIYISINNLTYMELYSKLFIQKWFINKYLLIVKIIQVFKNLMILAFVITVLVQWYVVCSYGDWMQGRQRL